jgi:HEAT repeat protein
VNTPPDKTEAESLSEAVLLALGNLDRAERQQAIEQASEAADPHSLIGMIGADDAVRRNAALDALTRGGRRSVPALVSALADADPEVVMFAAATLGKTRDPSAVPHLVQLLRHPDINVAQASIESLGQLRAASALSALADMLGGDPWLRFAVVHTMGEIGHPRSVETLLGVMDDPEMRDSAIDALGKIAAPAAIAALVHLLRTSDSGDDFACCLRALGRAIVQTPDPDTLARIPAWLALSAEARDALAPRLSDVLSAGEIAGVRSDELVKEAAIALVRVLRLPNCYPALIAAARDGFLADALLAAAVDVGADIAPHVVAALANGDRNVRLFACRAVGVALLFAGADTVVRLLEDIDEEIRAAALSTLARLGHAKGLRAMLQCLDDESPRVQGAAIEALSRMDSRAVTEAILASPEVAEQHRPLALAIMRENPHPAQRRFLEACLRDGDEDTRCAAVATLAAQPGSDVVETLEPLLGDAKVSVRREAIAAIGNHRCERARELLLALIERDPETRADAIRALRRVGDDRAVPRLIALFPACTTAEQIAIVDTLGLLEAPAAEPFLARQLGHADPDVRRHVAAALARLGTPAALHHLGYAVRDPEPRVRLALADALAPCPHPIAREALERLSLDPVPTVSSAARTHLGP